MGNSQAQGVAIGQWREHSSYNHCIAVTEGNDKLIYCATQYNLFSFNKDDESIQRYTKVNGLSDIGISTIRFNKSMNYLMVAYTDANIDILENGQIYNIPDIKIKNLQGKKNINHILFMNNYAYLSCGFGIVVVDVSRKEIKDTYYIGPLGSHIEVFGLAVNGNSFYAATESGVYQASTTNPNLANYESWTKHTTLPHPDGKYNAVVSFANRIVVNLSNTSMNMDTMYVFNGTSWNPYLSSISTSSKASLESMYGMLVTAGSYEINVYNASDNIIIHRSYAYPTDAIIDNDSIVWVTDPQDGLIKNWGSWYVQNIIPSGPSSSNVFDMSVQGSKLWVASGGRDDSWSNLWQLSGLYSFIDDKWSSYNATNTPGLSNVFDVTSITVSPSNPDIVYAATWGLGLLEFTNSVLTNVYNEDNSTLDTLHGLPGYYWLGIGGSVFDGDNNLWVTNSSVNRALSVKKNDGTWQSFDFSGLINNNIVGKLIIDNSNQKWIILPKGNGLLVFNDNNTIGTTSDDKSKRLNVSIGNGGLPSNNVLSLALDQDGEVWVGTDMGVVVFYSPEAVFSGSNFDAQYITLMQDGHAQHLLETETVNSIVVDGANQKWIGTQNAGVFLMSPDGTQELQHFTAENSPLFSNTIISIAVDNLTGEVFFGTDKGIISYKGEATAGNEVFSGVYAYPNPVKEDYTGLIGIKGLTTNANVKITDITGNVVFESVSKGGQAIWNGKKFDGERVKTGVYLVFCSSQDGSEKEVTKIMVIN